jgi:uncharacterized protein YlxW (UPF0749 family)
MPDQERSVQPRPAGRPEQAEPSEPGNDQQGAPPARPVTGRDRLLAALRHPSPRGQLIAAALLAVVGFASVVQVQANERDNDYEGLREEDLVQLLNSLSGASQRAENEIEELEQTRASLQSDTDSRRAALEQARQQADVLGILAGTLPASGPGVLVIVRDPGGRVGIDHILNGIQELRDSGAEAIEINDAVRVVAQTDLEDGQGGILVDDRQLTPPYTIEAIGDPHTLEQALEFTGGFVQDVETPAVGGHVMIRRLDNVQIATLHELESTEYAEPLEAE